jgi:uncharacterized damage-inducible protein DinB
MTTSDSLLPEFDMEMINTRKTLERIPEDKFGWKPHDKSFTLSKLSAHVATLPAWLTTTMTTDFLDISAPFPQFPIESRNDVMALFEKAASEARTTLMNSSDEDFCKPWSLKTGETVIFTMPKIAVIRSFMMNHLIHHRAQLGMYLRLTDVPVPGLYGPSADEDPM